MTSQPIIRFACFIHRDNDRNKPLELFYVGPYEIAINICMGLIAPDVMPSFGSKIRAISAPNKSPVAYFFPLELSRAEFKQWLKTKGRDVQFDIDSNSQAHRSGFVKIVQSAKWIVDMQPRFVK